MSNSQMNEAYGVWWNSKPRKRGVPACRDAWKAAWDARQPEIAALQAEVTRLSGKTGFCSECVRLTNERDAALAKVETLEAWQANAIEQLKIKWAMEAKP